jgi:hypothetical protein
MAKSKHKRTPKTVLKLPDLEQSKSAVMNSLTSASSKRSYDHAIREFIDCYCSEPRLAFNRTVVTRYRIALEQHPYAPSTINLRLAAIRRLAYEASDCGLLSPDLAAGIRRVKGVRRLGVRVGNWLTAEEGKKLLGAESADTLRSRRNRALLFASHRLRSPEGRSDDLTVRGFSGSAEATQNANRLRRCRVRTRRATVSRLENSSATPRQSATGDQETPRRLLYGWFGFTRR